VGWLPPQSHAPHPLPAQVGQLRSLTWLELGGKCVDVDCGVLAYAASTPLATQITRLVLERTTFRCLRGRGGCARGSACARAHRACASRTGVCLWMLLLRTRQDLACLIHSKGMREAMHGRDGTPFHVHAAAVLRWSMFRPLVGPTLTVPSLAAHKSPHSCPHRQRKPLTPCALCCREADAADQAPRAMFRPFNKLTHLEVGLVLAACMWACRRCLVRARRSEKGPAARRRRWASLVARVCRSEMCWCAACWCWACMGAGGPVWCLAEWGRVLGLQTGAGVASVVPARPCSPCPHAMARQHALTWAGCRPHGAWAAQSVACLGLTRPVCGKPKPPYFLYKAAANTQLSLRRFGQP